MFPQHDIPVIQLSLDLTQPAAWHYELGRRLAPLRDEGMLILGSGNVVHNLRTARWAPDAAPYDWAVQFNDTVRASLERRDHAALIHYERLGDPARLSIPTPEHYLPLLYAAALQGEAEPLSIVTDGMDLGSISMLSFAVGG